MPRHLHIANSGGGTFSSTGYCNLDFDDGEDVGESAVVEILVNDTPTMTADGLTDGMIVEPYQSLEVSVDVTDYDFAEGTVTAWVEHDSVVEEVPILDLAWTGDHAGLASGSIAIDGAGTYSVTFTFTDKYGASVTSDVFGVTANYAPMLTLDSPLSGEVVELPYNDPAYATYHYVFETADADDASVGVQPYEGASSSVACTYGAGGIGTWECDLPTSILGLGTNEIVVVVTDDAEEVRDSFTIEMVDLVDYDYDGDGVLESEYDGAGHGDCDPYDPTVHGASVDDSVEAAPEVCDDLDNDCDGTVNEGLPDADDDTQALAKPISSSGVVLTSGGSLSADGSLGDAGDVDWWSFESDGDASDYDNVVLDVTLTVAAAGSTAPAGEWSLLAKSTKHSGGVPTERVSALRSTDCASLPGVCVLTWQVTGDDFTLLEYYWLLAVSATDWDAAMCSDTASSPTYTLVVEKW